ncbi:MAG: iron ABC transporter permease [Clostridium sp.]|nr:iron ABC transporter permease [Clostridium sp.]
MTKKITPAKRIIAFSVTILAILVMFFIAINTGGLHTTIAQLFRGIFVEYDKNVAIILELRFPRIIVALLGGALMSVSGVLMQAVMKNPLADPGIIGISSGAALAAALVSALLPSLAYLTPVFSFAGGIIAFMLVYALSWNGNVSPIRLILVGIAVDAFFTGLYQAFSSATGGNYTGAASIINANISLKTWDDVRLLLVYSAVAVVCCIFIAGKCNLLALSDMTIHGLGVNVNRTRIIVSVISVLLASIFTAVVGKISFLGLIVPHISRLLVGNNHKVLIPYSGLLGAFIFLLADTVGRSVAYPYEISASIIMAIIGGPMFIILLKRSKGVYEQ